VENKVTKLLDDKDVLRLLREDVEAARAGMEWMRERYRAMGKTPTLA
jgi:hypothetical protein